MYRSSDRRAQACLPGLLLAASVLSSLAVAGPPLLLGPAATGSFSVSVVIPPRPPQTAGRSAASSRAPCEVQGTRIELPADVRRLAEDCGRNPAVLTGEPASRAGNAAADAGRTVVTVSAL